RTRRLQPTWPGCRARAGRAADGWRPSRLSHEDGIREELVDRARTRLHAEKERGAVERLLVNGREGCLTGPRLHRGAVPHERDTEGEAPAVAARAGDAGGPARAL